MPTKSPSGSACPYFFMNGELHPLKYGSFHADKDKLFRVMRAEEEFILKQPGQNDRRIWIDLYETKLDGEAARALARHVQAIQHKIRKLCFVGCSFLGAWRVRKQLARICPDLAKRIRFFSDPEMAKKWLIGETVQ